MQPRALWVASHHAELQGKLPGNWGNLLDGIDQLLIKSINDDSYAKVRPLASDIPLLVFPAIADAMARAAVCSQPQFHTIQHEMLVCSHLSSTGHTKGSARYKARAVT